MNYPPNMSTRACQSDDCEQNHCPKCGAHTMGWLDTFQKCSSCELEEEHQNSTNFYCEIHPKENVVRIFRGPKNMIGFVAHNNEKGDYLSVRGDEVNGVAHLTLAEIDIIMDNWNQCQEFRREGVEA